MKIAVFGLGYVGSVSAACLAADGHHVVGVDTDPQKVQAIRNGKAPVVEPGLDELVQSGVSGDLLRATDDASYAVGATDVSIVAVGTPSRPDGSADLSHVRSVMRQIGEALWERDSEYVVVLRSTVPPGTGKECLGIVNESAGHESTRYMYYPEFMREGHGIRDFREPSLSVIGTESGSDVELVRDILDGIDGDPFVTDVETAEIAKYASNAFHATKIVFANEMGRIAGSFGVDGRLLMEIMCSDTRLNISDAYLKPGFSYGGSCLPKDLRRSSKGPGTCSWTYR